VYELMRRLGLLRFYGVVSAGKEARVYRAVDRSGREYAVKIYLTFSREFKKSIWKYIAGDPRFEGAKLSSTKSLMEAWAKKEFKNLKKMHESGVRVPKPYGVCKNVLAMEFIGREGVRAPLLKEYAFESEEEARSFFEKVVENVKKCYCKAQLVHADLSEYNIMVFEGEPVLIDVAQAVPLEHPNAAEFFASDIRNLHRFFAEEVGVSVPSPEELARVIAECT